MKNISIYNLKKWSRMLLGKSILHVNQGIGKVYSKSLISGYYNDLTNKVLDAKDIDEDEIPKLITETGLTVFFPISIFQYGLGCYDLYLLNKDENYLRKFKIMVKWALENQESSGAWNTFFYIYPNAPYSAMAQGEGISLLIRAYMTFKDDKYLVAAKRAKEFMLLSITDGGTTLYQDDNIFLQEYIHKPTVLNGWIFAIFGLYDYLIITKDENLKEILTRTVSCIESELVKYDNGYWSMYNSNGMIASPFYHDLHIAQLEVLADLFENKTFKNYADKWKSYKGKKVNFVRAFIVKALQKIFEK